MISNIESRHALIAALLTFIPSGAYAQQADTAAAAGAPVTQDKADVSGSSVGDIVVTARKREERLQDTPLAVTALSAAALESRSVDSFKDFANAVPNVDINGGIPNGGGSAVQIFIRGVGQDDYSFPNEPGVGLYIDGVYITRSVGGD